MPQATIGVIGGSGLYSMEGMTDVEEVALIKVRTGSIGLEVKRVDGADGVSGLLVDPGDEDAMAGALAALAADPGLREAMGAQGALRHRERWNADTMVEGYARVLEELRPAAGSGAARSSSDLTSVPGARNRKL